MLQLGKGRIRLTIVVCVGIATGIYVGTQLSPPPAKVSNQVVQADGLPPADLDDDDLFRWAELTLAGQCMVRQGFRFVVDWKPDQKPQQSDNVYVETSLTQASSIGFGIGEQRLRGPSDVVDLNRLYVEQLPEDRQRAFTRALQGDITDRIDVPVPGGGIAGISKTGCLSEARKSLYGDLAEWMRLDTLWRNQQVAVFSKVIAHQDYTAALAKWRTCMKDKGWVVNDPGELRNKIAELYVTASSNEEALRQERKAAVHEVECAINTGLAEVAQRLDQQERHRFAQEHQADRVAYDQMRARARDQAQQLLEHLKRD